MNLSDVRPARTEMIQIYYSVSRTFLNAALECSSVAMSENNVVGVLETIIENDRKTRNTTVVQTVENFSKALSIEKLFIKQITRRLTACPSWNILINTSCKI